MSMVISGDNGLTFPAGSTQVQAGNYQTMVNRIINPRMEIDQRNAGASVSNLANTLAYTVDRWGIFGDQASKFTAQRSTVAPTGFINSLLITSSSAYSVPSGEAYSVQQRIEGFNVADLGWGTASAQTVTLSFWVRSSLTGTFGGTLVNSAFNRSYPYTYTISSANTWEQKSITIAGDTSGTWLTDNGIGIRVYFGLGVGSSLSGTAGAWTGSGLVSATGATSVVGTNGATFYITGVDLRVGSYTVVPQDFRAYGTELALCQRYCVKYLGSGAFEKAPVTGWATATTIYLGVFCLAVPMRTSPSLTSTSIAVSTTGGSSAITSVAVDQTSTTSPSFNFTTTGLTVGNASVVQANNSTSASIILSSEL